MYVAQGMFETTSSVCNAAAKRLMTYLSVSSRHGHRVHVRIAAKKVDCNEDVCDVAQGFLVAQQRRGKLHALEEPI